MESYSIYIETAAEDNVSRCFYNIYYSYYKTLLKTSIFLQLNHSKVYTPEPRISIFPDLITPPQYKKRPSTRRLKDFLLYLIFF